VLKEAWGGLDATLPSPFLIEAKKTKLLRNPFYSFNSAIDLNRLEYAIFFSEAVEENAKTYSVKTSVSPVLYRTKTNLILPVGRVLVAEGHDYYAHHRRSSAYSRSLAKMRIVL